MKKVFIVSFICIIILYFFMTGVPYFVEAYVIRTVVPENPFRNVFVLTASIIIVF